MNDIAITLGSHELLARRSGTLYWPAQGVLCVSDLHLGKSERMARSGGALLPPYETRDTLARLTAEIEATSPRHVICLGDSFDDLDAACGLDESDRLTLKRMAAGRDWTWIEGNHDPGPIDLPGSHRSEILIEGLGFRHIATDLTPEISGHYHPKFRLGLRGLSVTRPCFLADDRRVILPAFGSYTGGLSSRSPVLASIMGQGARAILTGTRAMAVPLDSSPA